MLRTEHRHYEDLGQLMTDMSPSSANETHAYVQEARNGYTYSTGGTRNWIGCGSVHECEDLIRRGWIAGREKAQKAIGEIARLPAVASFRRQREWAREGDSINMQRVYSGNLDRAWRRTRRAGKSVNRGHHVVRILVNVTVQWQKTAEEFFWRGAVATVLADLLEQSGRSIEIVGFYFAERLYYADDKRDENYCASFDIKKADQPLNLDRLATMTALSGFARHAIFNSFLSRDRRAMQNMGICKYGKIPACLQDEHSKTILVDGIWSKRDAEAFLKTVVEEFE